MSGGTSVLSGNASCARMTMASTPPTTKNTSAVAMYIRPSRLWSTVTTHSCSASISDQSTARAPAIRGRSAGSTYPTVLTGRPSLERREVRVHLVELAIGQLHVRHEIPRLHVLRIADPLSE